MRESRQNKYNNNTEKACFISQALVVQTSDSAIHRINHYPADSVLISGILIRWIVIYPVDSAIQRLNNQGQMSK